jgi:excisionase family DNA binding protein
MPNRSNRESSDAPLRDLASHLATYVTVNELARYWTISRKQIYKQIEQGNLPAIRLGPRSLRIRTSEALQFERQWSTGLPADDSKLPPVTQDRWPAAPRAVPGDSVRHLAVVRATAPNDSSSDDD